MSQCKLTNTPGDKAMSKLSLDSFNESSHLCMDAESALSGPSHGVHPPAPGGLCRCGHSVRGCEAVPEALDFHALFHDCEVCHSRPAMRLCVRCWRRFCPAHARAHYREDAGHRIYADYALSQHSGFWCCKCGGHTTCPPLSGILAALGATKGAFMVQPVTDKHLAEFRRGQVRVVSGTVQGWRADNEDAHAVYLGLPNTNLDWISVYDGHGGPLTAHLVSLKLHHAFDCNMLNSMADANSTQKTKKTLIKTFLKVDSELTRSSNKKLVVTCGCTANAVILDHLESKIYCANIGDTRAVLCRAGKAINLSNDHKPNLWVEKERITKAGGTVSQDNRVNGLLAVPRAFGDLYFKQATHLPLSKQAVTSLPDVTATNMNSEDQFIICACDGVWDSYSSQEVVDIILHELKYNNNNLKKAVTVLLDKCVALDVPETGLGTDNVSAILMTWN